MYSFQLTLSPCNTGRDSTSSDLYSLLINSWLLLLWYWNTQTFPEHEAYKHEENVWVKKNNLDTYLKAIWQWSDTISVVLTICRASWWQWSGPRSWSSDNHWYTDSPTYNSKLISCITEKKTQHWATHAVNKLCCHIIKKFHHLIPMVILAYLTGKTMSFWWWWSPCLF